MKITKEEAIKYLENSMAIGNDDDSRHHNEKAIKECEDCVSRKAVIDEIKSMSNANPSYWNKCDVIDREDLIDGIQTLQSVTPVSCIAKITFDKDDLQKLVDEKVKEIVVERKKGHWILLDECANSGYYCSVCRKKVVKEGWSNTVKKIKYCPNCGSFMMGED